MLVQNNVKEERKRMGKGVGSVKCRHTSKQLALFLNGTTGEWNSYISFSSIPVVHIGELSLGLGAEEQARWKIQEALWDSVNAL